MPDRLMIIGFKVNRFRPSHFDVALHELSPIVVVNGSIGIFFLVKFNESEPPIFFSNVVLGNLNRLDFPEGIEEGVQVVGCNVLWQIPHVDCPFVIALVGVNVAHALIK